MEELERKMGGILTTPSKQPHSGSCVEQNNNAVPQDKEKGNSKNAFSKFQQLHNLQECFPGLSGKERKFFNEKVPSYWSKTKGESKKKKTKNLADIYANADTNKKTKGHQAITVIPQFDDKGKLNLNKCAILSHEKHIYGTLNLSETLKYIGCYVYLRCRNLEGLKPSIVVAWIRGVDRSLVLSGWQEMGFVSQPNMIVLYMLLREVIPTKVRSITQLKALMMSTLYMCYAYNGHEISYPLKPFLFDSDRAGFWNRCMEVINENSDKLLLINKEPKYYNEIQYELKNFGRSLEKKEK